MKKPVTSRGGAETLKLAVGLLVTLFVPVAQGQRAPVLPAQGGYPSLTLSRLQQWGTAVATHTPGVADEAAVTIAAWPPGDLFVLFNELKRLDAFKKNPRVKAEAHDEVTYPAGKLRVREIADALRLTPEELRTGNINHAIERAALLHTDISLLVPKAASVPKGSPFSGRTTISTVDGRNIGVRNSDAHLEFTSWLLDGVRPDPAADENVRGWYRAIGATLERLGHFADAEWLLARGVELFPLDARLLFYSGTIDEFLATPPMQMALGEARLHPSWASGEVSVPQILERAAGFFRRALAADPEFNEARLHLGHVNGLLGAHEPAAADLRRAATAFTDEALQYYAALFLGREEDALGHREAARASFERASALYPRAQSPLLAESELARRAGDSAGAWAPLERLLALPSGEAEREDPWWWYETSHVRDSELLLSRWRVGVRSEMRAPR
jgi:tetratricopeptide (TPR) repeat protein